MQLFHTKTQPGQRSGLQVFHQHVRCFQQRDKYGAVILVLQVQFEAAFVVVAECEEITAITLHRRPRARTLAAGRLDLEHLRAKHAQLAPDQRGCGVLADLQHAQACEGQGGPVVDVFKIRYTVRAEPVEALLLILALRQAQSLPWT